jgi:hypothetical protein
MLIGAHIRQALDVFAHFDPQPFAQSSHVRCGRRPVEAVGRTQLSGTKEQTQIVDHTVSFSHTSLSPLLRGHHSEECFGLTTTEVRLALWVQACKLLLFGGWDKIRLQKKDP